MSDSSYAYGHLLDVSMKRSHAGIGMNMNIAWLCGHKGSQTGAQYKRVKGLKPIAWKCAACVAAAKTTSASEAGA